MVGEAALGEIVCPNTLTTIAAANLGAALLGELGLTLALDEVHEPRAQHFERFRTVFVLRLLVLAGDDNAQPLAIFRLLGDPHRRIRGIDTLPTWARGTKDINTQISRVDIDLNLFGLWQNGHSHGRGVDASLRFGSRNALHTVGAAFEFELAIDIFALYRS